jgi:hypothetical protein
MRDWKTIKSTNTFQDLVDKFNQNSESSNFIDEMLGKVLSNGILFNGNETINGKIIQPLTKVDLSGIVESDTILDNFVLYFRDTNNIVSLNQFPIDLLSYADGKPHFLYLQENLDYRISDYMFGKADEVLIGRFVINTDNTWNHFYIMAQRAGTPMYNAADEFYTVDGMYVKSPGGLELSQTSGTVKRSGIDFTDKVSPDVSQFYNVTSERVPIRYINIFNEVDYTKDTTYEIEPNKYMIYNMNKNLKIDAEELIAKIQNLYYLIDEHSNEVADELHESIIAGGSQEDLTQIVHAYTDYINIIYSQVDVLYNLLDSEVLSSVNRDRLKENKEAVDNYLEAYLNDSAIDLGISEVQVTAIRNFVYYILNTNLTVCNIPLEDMLQEVQDDLNSITFDAGSILEVPEGKFTIQRILWDVYEKSLICQYGDTLYDTFNQAVQGTGLLEYPAPFGKTIYIPLAIIVLKSGITSINDDSDTIIIDRRWIEVDQENSGYADYVARAKADKALDQITKILNGDIAVAKADSLKYTDSNGNTQYVSGDYYLDYNNLNNKVEVINNLTTNTYNSKQALSAYQGYILNNNKVDKSGDTMTGTLNGMNIIPKTTDLYTLGNSSKYWDAIYVNSIYKGSTSNTYVYSTGSSVLDVRALAKSSVTDSYWSKLPNKTLLFCW